MQGDLITRCIFLRDYRGGREKAEAFLALAREDGFPYWEAAGLSHLGQVAVQEGANEEGIQAILAGREMLRVGGEIFFYQWVNDFLPDAYLAAKRPGEGLVAATEALAAADQLQMRAWEAELHRVRGELLLLAGAPESEAQASMRRAIAIAKRQEAKGWELRATIGLARLLRKQGKSHEAREVLAPVYNWFTEGFDTADLKDAKALLDELSG